MIEIWGITSKHELLSVHQLDGLDQLYLLAIASTAVWLSRVITWLFVYSVIYGEYHASICGALEQNRLVVNNYVPILTINASVNNILHIVKLKHLK